MAIAQTFQQQCADFAHRTAVKRWVIALSGGLDSMVTLELAHRFLPSTALVAIHVNHNQQRSADHWQEFCSKQCQQRNIEYHSFSIEPAGCSEQLLRDARYQCFENFLTEGDCLLLGHHANDQAETLLFRLVRGAGPKGLAAMPVQRRIGKGLLLRPLLAMSRSSLEKFAQENTLNWIDDPSNQSLDYDRNYLRHKVLAPLIEHWPKACEQMALSSQLVSQEQKLLNQYLHDDLAHLVTDNRLDLKAWRALEREKAVALLRFWIGRVVSQGLSKKALKRILDEVIGSRLDSSAYCPLGNYQLRRFKDHLYIIKTRPLIDQWPVLSAEQKQYSLAQGIFSWKAADTGIVFKRGMYLTTRLDGMALEPANRSRKKLVKLFQEHGVAPWLRDVWPVLMHGEEIVAVPGICICEGWQESDQNKSLFWPQWQAL